MGKSRKALLRQIFTLRSGLVQVRLSFCFVLCEHLTNIQASLLHFPFPLPLLFFPPWDKVPLCNTICPWICSPSVAAFPWLLGLQGELPGPAAVPSGVYLSPFDSHPFSIMIDFLLESPESFHINFFIWTYLFLCFFSPSFALVSCNSLCKPG